MSRKKVPSWTECLVLEEAKKYNRRGDFARGSNGAYQAAKRVDILEAVCEHMLKKKWTIDSLRAEALKYSDRSEFMRGSRSAHVMASRMGVIELVCSHMRPVLEQWDETKVRQIASSYFRLSDFRKNEPNAYVASLRLGIKDEIISPMQRDHHNWTDRDLAEIASGFTSVSEFKFFQPNPYSQASKRGILASITAHMTCTTVRQNMLYCVSSDHPFEGGEYLVKIGVTSTFRANSRVAKHMATWFDDAKVLFLVETENARNHESVLLVKYAKRPSVIDRRDGFSELRLVDGDDVLALKNYGEALRVAS